ncbi:electron transfer flavoprotein subunit alpha/FixB family protein [soil metagenome]
MKVLVCAETRSGVVQFSSLELVNAARGLATGGTVEILAISPGALQGAIAGVDEIIHVDSCALGAVTAEAYGAVLKETVDKRRPDVVLCSNSALGLDVAPALAAQTGWPLVGYCVSLASGEGGIEAVSQIYGGKVLARTRTPCPAIFVVNPGSFPDENLAGASAPAIMSLTPRESWQSLRVTFRSENKPETAGVDIARAERIVSAGRGIGEQNNLHLITELAEALDAEIAGSRPVIDGGWLPRERQVGKSGRKVKPKLYFAIGISGAPEHLEGMSKSDLIIAVNSDPKAPIFNVAHFGSTCDLFDLVPALTERLKAEI